MMAFETAQLPEPVEAARAPPALAPEA